MTDNNVVVGLDDFLAAKFDYLVLGGGMAGLAVAGRLAEDPNISVGVLEAGKDRRGDPLVDMPLAMPQMFENSDYDWVHRTAPQVRISLSRDMHIVALTIFRNSTTTRDTTLSEAECWVDLPQSMP